MSRRRRSTPLPFHLRVFAPADLLLVHAAVETVRAEAKRESPAWAREKLAEAARVALETTGHLDAGIGGLALVAACATESRILARAFRSTPKTVKKVVTRPKEVATRVLDLETSQLAGLHRDVDSLGPIRYFVENLWREIEPRPPLPPISADVVRATRLVGESARGATFEALVIDAWKRGELNGELIPPELAEEDTYATLLEPMIRRVGLHERWRVTRHGYGPSDRMYEDADGHVVLESTDGRVVEAQAKPHAVGSSWYDWDVVVRLLDALRPELAPGLEFYVVTRDVPDDQLDELVPILTALEESQIVALRGAGLVVDPVRAEASRSPDEPRF